MHPQTSLDARELGQRMRDYGLNTLAQVAALIMGAVFATAAFCFVDIVQSPELLLIRLTLWAAGVLNCWLALTRILHACLMHVRPSAVHLPLILAWGMLATINFALIGDATGGEHGWRHVYLVGVFLNVVAMALAHVETATAAVAVGSSLTEEVTRRRIREFGMPISSTVPGAIVALAIYFVALRAVDHPDPWLSVVLVANIVGCLSFIVFIVIEMRSFHRFIVGIEAANAVPPPVKQNGDEGISVS